LAERGEDFSKEGITRKRFLATVRPGEQAAGAAPGRDLHETFE
jgi:hypothetical protein